MAKRIVIVTLVAITLLLGVVVRREYLHYQQPLLSPTIRLGCIRNYPVAMRSAFEALVSRLEQHPDTPMIIVEWKGGTFLDYLRSRGRRPYEDTLSRALVYNRARGRFAMYEPVNGTTNFDWYQVQPDTLIAVRDRGDDFTDLSSYGCRSALP